MIDLHRPRPSGVPGRAADSFFIFFFFFFFFGFWSDTVGMELVHQFFVRTHNRVVKPRRAQNGQNDKLETQEQSGQQRYRVFGMTARIVVDAARVAYDQEPEFEHNSHFGDEAMIAKLRRLGRLSETRKPSDGLTRDMMEKAAKLS